MWLIIPALIIVISIVLCIIFVDNKTVQYENFTIIHDTGIENDKKWSQLKVLFLSDMHFPLIFVDIDSLLSRITTENPDIIAITGDIIKGDCDVINSGVFEFIMKLKKATDAPIYYVNGNHENRNKNSFFLYDFFQKNGVTMLDNCNISTKINDKNITLIGVCANSHYDISCYNRKNTEQKALTILLAHRPENHQKYVCNEDSRPDIVLCGHAHGGQIRLFGQGLFAPGQGFFPKYTSGKYTICNKNGKKTTMIVSRGLGGSVFPLRFNNRPHVGIITLKLH